MHLGRSLLLICIALSLGVSARAQEDESADGESYSDGPGVSYSKRRDTIGAILSFGYSAYDPQDYRPDFVANQTYGGYYDSPDSPLLEATVGLKFNFLFMSLSADLGAGYFSNQGKDGAKLDLTPVRAGGTLALDGVFSEPYFAPYFSLGAYTVFYRESIAAQSVSGRTTPALYYSLGARIQLDALDEGADLDSYVDFGIENTFLYVEARNFAATSDVVVDLSTPASAPAQIGLGLALEF
jgi:hypothetical protein